MRFILEIISRIRSLCGPDFPIAVRLSVDEYYRCIGRPGQGIELADGIAIAKRLEQAGVDAIDVSSANYETMNYWLEPISYEPGWRKDLAKAVKDNVKIPVLAANLIRSPEQAESQIAEGYQDFVCLGRPHLADPSWTNKTSAGCVSDIKRCICCLWCFESFLNNATHGEPLECAVNPRLGRERETASPLKNGAGRVVAVIGAGPAGLSAAEILGLRGFKPIVFEKNAEVGGQLQLANKPPIDGADQPHVCTVTEILDGSVKLNRERVAVIGSGMTGLETAEKLCEEDNRVLVVEMMDQIGPGTHPQHLDDVLPRLKGYHTEFISGHKLVKITSSGIILEDTKTGQRMDHVVDHVVLAVGVRSNDKFAKELRPHFVRLYTIGDARKVGRIAHAVRDGFDVAWNLQ